MLLLKAAGGNSPPFLAHESGKNSNVCVVREDCDMGEGDKILMEKYGFLRALVDSAEAIIFSLDRKYCYLEFTRAHEAIMKRLWGVEIRTGMSMLDLIGDSPGRNIAKARFDRALRGEVLEEAEEFGSTLVGRAFYKSRYGPVRLADGSIVGLTVCMSDESESKRLEVSLAASEAGSRMLFETMLQGVVYQNADGKIISMNPAAERILGKTREEFLGSNSEREERHTIHEDGSLFPGAEHPAMVALKTGRSIPQVVMGVWNPQRNGYRWINVSAVPLFVPEVAQPSAVYTVFEDITEIRQLQEELRAINRELESRVADRTTSLQATVRELEREISKRRELELEILSISEREQCRIGLDLHEGLGQELAGISFIGDVVASRLAAEGHPLSETAAQMIRSIRSTISTTRLLAKGLYPVELDRYGLIAALADLAQRTQEHYGIVCNLESEKLPKGNKSSEIHIFRIVQECVLNAIKHSAAGKITLEARRYGEGLCFIVTDDGIGFDPSKKRSGMGLDIMDYRAREIGGEIRIENPSQGGSRVLCLIPD